MNSQTLLKLPHASIHPGKSEAAEVDRSRCAKCLRPIIGNLNHEGSRQVSAAEQLPPSANNRSPVIQLGFFKKTKHVYKKII